MLSVAAASSRCCLGDRGFIALGLLTIRTPCALTPASHSGQDLHTFHFSIGCDGSNLDLGHRNASSRVQWKRRSVVPACLHAEPGSCRSRRCECIWPLGLWCLVLPGANIVVSSGSGTAGAKYCSRSGSGASTNSTN